MESIRQAEPFSLYAETLRATGKLPSGEGWFSGTPARVGRYRILEKLGEGGMGMVYKARDERLHRYAAVKLLRPHLRWDPDARLRFEQEARAAAAVEHPNVATVYEIGTTEPAPWEPDGQPYIVMAFYAGETLREKIARGPLPIHEVLDYACQIAAGLDKAHECGICHRDVKPANVIVTENGLVKIVDFGLAKTAGVTITSAGTALGSAAYMSPEQTRGADVDHRTDIWSLGVVIYEMLTGNRPFHGDIEPAVAYSILHTDPRPLREIRPDVSVGLERIVSRCMAKNPSARYATVAALLAELIPLTYGGRARGR